MDANDGVTAATFTELADVEVNVPPVAAPGLVSAAQSAKVFAVVAGKKEKPGAGPDSARRVYDPWSQPLPIKAAPGRKPPGPPAPPAPAGPGTGESSDASSTRSTGDWKQVPLQGWVPLDNGLGRTYWWDTISNVVTWDFPQRPAGQHATVEDVE